MKENEHQLSRRDFMKTVGLAGVAAGVAAAGLPLIAAPQKAAAETATVAPGGGGGGGTAQQLQCPLPGTVIPRFMDPLPKLDVGGGPIQTLIAGTSQVQIEMEEFRAYMLPRTFNGGTYRGTWVWGYVKCGTNTDPTRETYTGPVVVAKRNIPTEMKFINGIGTTGMTSLLPYLNGVDQSLHWANPNNASRYVRHPLSPPPWVGNPAHYRGSIPVAVHLHGGEVPAALDGGPEAWFTGSGLHGKAFYSKDRNTSGNYCIYRYPNMQEAAPLWFHDHTLGATRLNVYCGLAGGYILTDPGLTLPPGLSATGLSRTSGGSPNEDTVIPLVLQDRMFDNSGQLYFPAGPLDPIDQAPNPEHKWWIPEFFGNTACVNGKTWPYLQVRAQRYRFLVINGSNARTWVLTFMGDPVAPPMYQIGTDQGYLDTPVPIDALTIMPGERADLILDFGGIAPGTNIPFLNFGPDEPYNGIPGGQDPADPLTTGMAMLFKVVAGAPGTDTSYDPSSGTPLRTGSAQIVRLVDAGGGALAPGVTPALWRQLTLNEIVRDVPQPFAVDGVLWAGGPLEVLVNNTRWMGTQPDETNPNNMMTMPDQMSWTADGVGNYVSEMPSETTTEVWEIVNLTMDAHPIHTHLAQFQIMNREQFDMDAYMMAYNMAFPGGGKQANGTPYPPGVFMPGYGPPLPYTPAGPGKYGGNPDVGPFLSGAPQLPTANELGWKDTVQCPPGFVTRFVVRWAPQDVPVTPSNPALLRLPFLPNDPIPGKPGAKFDYVWHCHIIDHEDNEMMRPDIVVPATGATRTYVLGRDY